MSGARYFLDTNVLVYCLDRDSPAKQRRALSLVRSALARRAGVISFQVVQESLNTAGRKFAETLSTRDLLRYLDRVLAPLCEVFPSIELYREALELRERWEYAFYDSMIIAAALAAGCARLYTEDLQDGQSIKGLTIEDPFRSLE